jgi:LPXTG-site transpeptidase (sortase) family protein
LPADGSCMSPDTSRPACRVSRGPARYIAGLALVAVTAACGSADDNDASAVVSTPAPTPATTTSAAPTAIPAEPTESQSKGIKGPYTLRIPRIGVDAPVISIQSNENRVLEPPRDPRVAGWWSDGALPGESEGSAVLVGHTVRNKGGGVFDDMGDLRGGDVIEVEGSEAALTYHVQSVDVLSKDEVARVAEEIFDQSGPGRLVVITCDDFDGTVWQSNIVTIAAPV